MRHIKTFESLNIDDELEIEITYFLINEFQTEDDFNNFCVDYQNAGSMDDVDANAIPDDVIEEYQIVSFYPNEPYDTLRNIVMNVLTDIDLDDCDDIRKMTLEEYKISVESKKYNI